MRKKIKEGEKGRRCKMEGCKTILSIYNEGEYCFIHSGYENRDYALLSIPGRIPGRSVDRYFLFTLAKYEGWQPR